MAGDDERKGLTAQERHKYREARGLTIDRKEAGSRDMGQGV